jgi:tartrate dehydratase beta subunit/fumarate hydratase class I family protein
VKVVSPVSKLVAPELDPAISEINSTGEVLAKRDAALARLSVSLYQQQKAPRNLRRHSCALLQKIN